MASKLTPKTKKLGLAGLAVLMLVVILQLLVLKPSHKPSPMYVAPVVHHVKAGAHKAARRPQAPKVDPTLPAPLRRALARHAVVVAVIYAPTAAGDSDAVKAA